MRLPDFFIIGAAKCGTTSLHALLSRHPDLFLSDPKEPEFFARDDRFRDGLESYARLFADAGPRLAGEASTLYSLHPLFPGTAARLAATVPDARLVYMMRDPIERAYSYYIQLVKNRQNATGETGWARSFEEFVLPEAHRPDPERRAFAPFDDHLPDVPELCLAGGDYVIQIETYLAHFPRDRLLCLKFEDFRAAPDTTANAVAAFLGVPPFASEDAAISARNVSARHFQNAAKDARIARLRQLAGPVWRLRHVLPAGLRGWAREAAAAQTTQIATPPSMRPETWHRLAARYRPMLAALQDQTGLTFDDWMVKPPPGSS